MLTAEGVSMEPSAFGISSTAPFRHAEARLLVVPRSIPMIMRRPTRPTKLSPTNTRVERQRQPVAGRERIKPSNAGAVSSSAPRRLEPAG